MFEHTRPADLDGPHGSEGNDGNGANDRWAEFRVTLSADRLALLRELRDGSAPVMLNAPGGAMLAASLWSVDSALQRLNFSVEAGAPQLAGLVDADEVVAVAYLQSVKLQFDLHDLVLVRGTNTAALQAALPTEIYRFQRRNAYRVRPPERVAPRAHMRHPALPDMVLALRVLDVSMGGCALWLPHDVPPLQAGTRLGEIKLALDADTRFVAPVTLLHVTSAGTVDDGGVSQGGVRLGCEWPPLGGDASRVLQRWIDRTQQRRRLLSLE